MTKITLNQGQQAAADAFMDFMLDGSQTEMVIGGFAGTGKSTLVRHILTSLFDQLKVINTLLTGTPDEEVPIYLTATTNKAAQVIAKMNGSKPQTIHSLLNLRVENDLRTGETRIKPGKNYGIRERALIIIDEASFIDEQLLSYIRKSTFRCKVLYLGDPYQLAPIYSTNPPVFHQPIPKAELSQVMRNEGEIERIAGQFRTSLITGQFEPIVIQPGSNVEHVDEATYQHLINQAFADPHRDDNACKIVAWSNGRVHQYNDYIRNHLYGLGDTLTVGERVITNAPILANQRTILSTDDHATVKAISGPTECHEIEGNYITLSSPNGEVEVFQPKDPADLRRVLKEAAKEKHWRTYFEIKDGMADLRPIHACTTHKSQGSTYDTVFVDLSDIGRCNIASDVSRMLYVAISRAAKKVVLYGELPARYGGKPCTQNASPISAAS